MNVTCNFQSINRMIPVSRKHAHKMVQKVQKPPFVCKQAPNPLIFLTFWRGGFCTIALQKPAETCNNPLGIM